MIVAGAAAPAAGQTIEVTPPAGTVFRFSGSEGGPFVAETPTLWTVEDVDNAGLMLNVVSDQPWLVPVPSTGTLPGRFRDSTLEVAAELQAEEAARLAPGVYTATVSFLNVDTGQGNTERTVELRVAAAHFSVTPPFANGFAVQNAPSPPPVEVTVTGFGTADLNYELSFVPRPWFTVDKEGGTVPAGGTDTFEVLFNAFGLAPGTYSAQILVANATNGAGSIHLPVSLIVSASSAGAVLLSPSVDIQVRGVAGFLTPVGQQGILTNDSDRFVLWQATSEEPWISVTPSGGELAPAGGGAGGPDEQGVEIRANLAVNDLPAGSHVGTLTFENLTTGVPIATRLIHVVANPVLTLPEDSEAGVVEVRPAGLLLPQAPGKRITADFGSVVTLTAVAGEGFRFEGWVTDLELASEVANPIVVPMDASRSVGAVFAPVLQTLTLSVSGSGTGTARPDPLGSFVENTSVFRYTNGQVVTVAALADAGSVFAGWSGNVPAGTEEANPLELVMDRARVVTARFEPAVSVVVEITGEGNVTIEPDLAVYPAGATVMFIAEPGEGFELAEWGGAASGRDSVLSLTLNADTVVTASFVPEGTVPPEPTEEEFDLFVDVEGDGVVSPSSGTFEAGAIVTLIATPGVGSTFVRWTGDASGAELATTVVMDRVRTVGAVFETDPSAGSPADGARLCGAMGGPVVSILLLLCVTLTGTRRRW